MSERLVTQVAQFVIGIFLARAIVPEVFGKVAMLMVVVNVLTALSQAGMINALVQKRVLDDSDLSSGLLVTLAISIGMIATVIIFSESIIGLLSIDIDPIYLWLLCLIPFMHAISTIHHALIQRSYRYRILLISQVIGIGVGAVVVFSLLSVGAELAALTMYNVTLLVVSTIVTITVVPVDIKWQPRMASIMSLWSYSQHIMAAVLLESAEREVRSFMIGRFYNPSLLALYNRGEQLPRLSVQSSNVSLQYLLFARLSEVQNRPQHLMATFRRAIKVGTVMAALLCAMVYSAGPIFIMNVLGKEWAEAIPFLKIFCFVYALGPLMGANAQCLKAIGLSNLVARRELYKKIIGLTSLVILFVFGPYVFALMMIPIAIVNIAISAAGMDDYAGVGFYKQLLLCGKPLAYFAFALLILEWITLNYDIAPFVAMTLPIIYFPVAALIYISLIDKDLFHWIVSSLPKATQS